MSMKGEEYEYRLALNAMVSAILEEYPCFAVAFAIGKGKFDDVAFRYRLHENESDKLIVLQAKNKATNVDNLLGDEGDFSLPKYFHSYFRICSGMETEFIGMELEELVIFTSADLSKKANDLLFEMKKNSTSSSGSHQNPTRRSEDIFNFPLKREGELPKRKRYGIHPLANTFKEIREKAYMKRLARLLITALFDKNQREISENSLIADFQFPLSEFVLDLQTNGGDSARFRKDFLNLQFSEPDNEKFFKILKKEFDDRKKQGEFSKINEYIDDKKMKLKVFPKFGRSEIAFSSKDEVHQLVKEMHGNITNNLPLDHNKGIISKFHISLVNDNVIKNGRLKKQFRVGHFTSDAIEKISIKRTIILSRKPSLDKGKEWIQWMLNEKFTTESDDLELEEGFGESGVEEQLKFDSEEEAVELATKLHNDIKKRIMLDHKSGILSKFHRPLVAQEIIDPSRKKLHPSILRRPEISNGKEFLLWMLAKTFTSQQYENEIQLAKGFGEVEWPQITDDKVKNYLKHLTLAVGQPNEDELVDYIKKSIQLMVPLSQKSVDDIYKDLEEKMRHWYKHKKGKWLHREKFLKWVIEASDQEHTDLINPLNKEERRARRTPSEENRSETRSLKWKDLNQVAQEYLLRKKILFFGAPRKLNELVDKDCKDLHNLKNLKDCSLIRNEIIEVGKQHIGNDPTMNSRVIPDKWVRWYVERTIARREIKSEFNGNSQIVEISNEMEIDRDGDIQYLANQSINDRFYRRFGTSMNSELSLYEEEELLDQVGGIVIISGVAGMGKSTLLISIKRKLKKKNPKLCILLLDLSDRFMKDTLNKFKTGEMKDYMDVLNRMCLRNPEDDLEKLLFWQNVKKNGNVVLILDGYDRVPDHQENIIQLLKELKERNINQLWVTTRTLEEVHLMAKFGKPANVLLPFTPEKQIDYLVKLRPLNNDTMEQKKNENFIKNEATKVIKEMETLMGSLATDFTGIPLHCRILAKIVETDKISTYHLIFKVCEELWNRRFKFCWNENLPGVQNSSFVEIAKEGTQIHAMNILQRHALEQLFGQENKQLWKDLPTHDCRHELGLASGSNQLHHLVAAYFASLYLYENREKKTVSEFMKRTELTSPNYSVIQQFLTKLSWEEEIQNSQPAEMEVD